MKLLDEFRAQVRALGPLKRAWFTTFNLGIPFFETHVLPALLDTDTPVNRMDYETLQLLLTEQGVDVRVFCDLRVMETDQLKRTAVSMHGVLPDRLPGVGFGAESLFHPKVIFLEDEKGRMVLGAGSANLTLRGWARNQEVFAFRTISNNHQYQQVKRFFEPLAEWASLDGTQVFGVRRKFDGQDDDWRFVHSFEGRTFLEHLLHGTRADRLTIWSPYFARDLAGLLEKVNKAAGSNLKVSIVPDRIGNRHLRTVWSEKLGELMTKELLSFHNPPSPRAQDMEFTHAKLWLSSGRNMARLAIGSWNCTGRGTSSFELRNVEAGILWDVAPKTVVAGTPLELTAKDFCSEEMLEEQNLELLIEPPPFDLQVCFDWEEGCYEVQGRLIGEQDGKAYRLQLPGVMEPEWLRWKQRRSQGNWPLESIRRPVADNEALLANHCYEVWCQGNLVYRGLVEETGQGHRRAQGYDSLKDLLNDLINNAGPQGSGAARLRKALRHNDVPGDESSSQADIAEDGGLTYFRLFYAFEQFRERLRKAGSPEELERILFVHPGSLQELVAKVNSQIDATGATVFNWFLLKEVDSLHAEAQKKWDGRRKQSEKWKSLTPKRSRLALPSQISGNKHYMQQLREICGYER